MSFKSYLDAITIYISSSGDSKEEAFVKSFKNALESNSRYKFEILKRGPRSKSIDNIETQIQKSNLFIAFITNNYFHSELSKIEFNFSFGIEIPCLYIKSQNFKEYQDNQHFSSIVNTFDTTITLDLYENFQWTPDIIEKIDANITKVLEIKIESEKVEHKPGKQISNHYLYLEL